MISVSSRHSGVVFAGLCVISVAACADGPAPLAVQAFTLFDVAAHLEATRALAGTPQDTLPTGFAVAGMFTRAPAGPTFTLDVAPSLVEGEHAAYVSGETWRGFDRVWMQPMYVLARRDAQGVVTPIAGEPPLFSVGPTSAFYSPFWRVFHVIVPDDRSPDRYRSTHAMFADGLALVPGPGRLCVLAPVGVDISGYVRVPEGQTPPADPVLPTPIGAVRVATGLVDGADAPVQVLAFGDDRFTWDDQLVVEEAALFVLHVRNPQGQLAKVGLPTVGGTGPLLTRTPPRLSRGRPAFGSLWRIVRAELPASAGIVVPAGNAALAARGARIRAAGLTVVDTVPPWLVGAGEDERRYHFRPVLDGRCLLDANVPCVFLDSQRQVETHLGASLRATDQLATCPLVVYQGQAVPL